MRISEHLNSEEVFSGNGLDSGIGERLDKVKVLASTCDAHLYIQVARSHHIPRVKLRPWLSLVALQEVEEGGWKLILIKPL